MNTHDIDQIIDRIESCAPMDVAGRNKHLHDLRSAIESDRQRIAELESQLEAVGAGGVPLMGCQQCTKLKVVLQAVLDDKATVLSRGVYDQIREALA